MITRFKIYELQLSDIENIEKIKNEKYLYILEWYAVQIDKEYSKNKINLNIPIDLYYCYEPHTFSTKKLDCSESRHFDKITDMWMSLKKQHFKEFKESPYFLIEVEGEYRKNSVYQLGNGNIERFIIHYHDEKDSNEIIIDIIYNYIHDNYGEIISANKYNL